MARRDTSSTRGQRSACWWHLTSCNAGARTACRVGMRARRYAGAAGRESGGGSGGLSSLAALVAHLAVSTTGSSHLRIFKLAAACCSPNAACWQCAPHFPGLHPVSDQRCATRAGLEARRARACLPGCHWHDLVARPLARQYGGNTSHGARMSSTLVGHIAGGKSRGFLCTRPAPSPALCARGAWCSSKRRKHISLFVDRHRLTAL